MSGYDDWETASAWKQSVMTSREVDRLRKKLRKLTKRVKKLEKK